MRAAVASVETVRGGGLKVKLWNKNNALDSLGRWRRMFVELQERGKPGERSPGRRRGARRHRDAARDHQGQGLSEQSSES